jgi:hypothetical protein
MKNCLIRVVLGGFAGVVLGFGLAAVDEAQAGEPTLDCASVVQLMLGNGPLPAATVQEPTDWDQLSALITDHAWQMPELRPWPVDDDGRPIVETRRKDQMWHEVGKWETAARLRNMYRRTTAQLQELNPDLDLRNLEKGQEVLIWERDEEVLPESRGEPRAGRLIYGEPMPKSDDYIVLFPHRAFGTYYAISETVRILDEYYEAFPDADPLIVGDFSFRTGRSINPHNSHQSGRDVDVTLPRHEPPPNYNRFHHVRRDNLDAERTLWILTTLLEGGYVEYIFLDRHHQRTLYRLARDQGAPEEWLDEVFQYPGHGRGIIRHEPGHATHFHVRFHCQETDRWCR